MAVYLDHNATSPMHAEVIDAMLPFISNPVGNPSSLPACGRMARAAIEATRAQVARLLGCDAASIIFTSGGSEADNPILKGDDDPGAGLSRAAELTRLEFGQRRHHLQQLRDMFETRLRDVDEPIATLTATCGQPACRDTSGGDVERHLWQFILAT